MQTSAADTERPASVGTGLPGGFGKLLRSRRRAAGLTQEELAERSGLSVRAVSDIERGRTARPYPRSTRMIVDALCLTGPAREEFLSAADAADGFFRSAEPRQLPADVNRFSGRTRELAALHELTHSVNGVNGAAAVIVISGTGQPYVNLHGFGPSGSEQVRLLLPGTAACQVIVTSRDLLLALATAGTASQLTLDLLSSGQAGCWAVGWPVTNW